MSRLATAAALEVKAALSDQREVSAAGSGLSHTISTAQSDGERSSLEAYNGDPASSTRRPAAPTTGMRGGLGRTLLTAFLILTIVPLSLVGWYAIEQNHRNTQREMERRLQTVAVLKAGELRQWFTQFETLFRFSTCTLDAMPQPAASPDASARVSSLDEGVSPDSGFVEAGWWRNLRGQVSSLSGISFMDAQEVLSWSLGECLQAPAAEVIEHPSDRIFFRTDTASLPADLSSQASDVGSAVSAEHSQRTASTVILSLPQERGAFLFCLRWDAIAPVLRIERLGGNVDVNGAVSEVPSAQNSGLIPENGHIYLVHDNLLWPTGRVWRGEGADVLRKTSTSRSTSASYVNHLGIPVIGAYTFVEELGVGVLVEQEQPDLLASSDRIATTLIALTLAVALTTTIIAAVVIRQITRPVIMLTESALAMAEGDLNQHLQVASQDEIGILTYVFNKMAAELNQLYAGLEAKVAERTKMLQRANYQIQQRAIQLKASQEVGQAITSMRDPDALLHRVVDLIRDRFLFASVAIYLVEPGGGEARLQALGPTGASWPKVIQAGDGSVIEKALRKGTLQVASEQTGEPLAWQRRTLIRIVVPLRMGERILGTLAVLNAERELGGTGGGVTVEDRADDMMVLELLANQVAVALENAQAYERERHAARKLEEAEAFKAHFLANMSHELREPLNTIMGFTRLMLKGLDGPLTPAMTQDLDRIYDDSQHLLALINDILAISEIQAGLMELKIQPVDLQEVVDSVMPTASALVRGKDIALVKELDERLPLVRADPTRVRQVLIHLLTNAAKFTEAGNITIQAWHDEELVYVSVSDTGVGIPPEDRERIFTKFATGVPTQSREGRLPGVGLGLALSKEFVELHGGQIWVKSEVGKGTTFTFSLPYYGEGVALGSASDLSDYNGLSSYSDKGRRQ